MTNKNMLYIDNDLSVLEKIRSVDRLRGSGDFNNMLPVVKNAVPSNVLISCPAARRMMSQAKSCTGCQWYNGTVQTTYNDESEMLWSDKFAISCGFPMDRKCISFSIEA